MPKRKAVETVGARLARLRRERGLTQAELARLVGLAQPNICEYERGAYTPNAPLIIRLAQVLGVSSDALLGIEPIKREVDPLDRAVLRRLTRIKDLSRRDRVAVLRTLDAFIDRGRNGRGRRVQSG